MVMAVVQTILGVGKAKNKIPTARIASGSGIGSVVEVAAVIGTVLATLTLGMVRVTTASDPRTASGEVVVTKINAFGMIAARTMMIPILPSLKLTHPLHPSFHPQ